MYKEHFGLSESPFSIAPDPRYLFMSERHREALAHLLYGIKSNGGFVLLTGEVGTGKTTVCRCLLEQIPESVDLALILNPKLSVEELLATICDELKIRYPKGKTTIKGFIDRLNDRLLDAHARGRNTVLIIDEAQNLSIDVLEQLRLLTNLETNQHKLLQIILLGQPELKTMLSRPELRQLAQRITARFHLEPLSRREVATYVTHRLSVAGQRSPLFSSSALKRLYQLSAGIPRRINLLCDRALLGCYTQNTRRVGVRTLEKAAREVDGEKRQPSHLGWYVSALMASGALALVLTFYPGVLETAPGAKRSTSAAESKPAARPDRPKPLARKKAAKPAVLTWPERLPLTSSRVLAFRDLFRQWDIDYPTRQNIDPCLFAEAHGLKCLSGAGSLGELAHTNRPAILRLTTSQGAVFYATMVSLNKKEAGFIVAGQAVTVPTTQLMSRWLGHYTLLWRTPPGFNGEIRPGYSGQAVNWLGETLARIQGGSFLPREETLFDGQMVQSVKSFQQRSNLAPDGIVGAMTIIQLNTKGGVRVPMLSAPRANT